MISKQYLVCVGMLVLMIGLLGFARDYERTPEKRPFQDFPVTIAERWHGRDLSIDQEVLAVLKADDVLMREYAAGGGEALWLYSGYYRSQRAGATYHSPMNCLPGGGWSILSRQQVPVVLGGRAMAINRVVIAKGLDKQLILYWYHDRGRIIPDEYWAKGYLIWDAMTQNRTDGALVRLSIPVTGSTEQAFETGIEFLDHAVPILNRYLPS